MVNLEKESHNLFHAVILIAALHRHGGELGRHLKGSHPLEGTAGVGFGEYAKAMQGKGS